MTRGPRSEKPRVLVIGLDCAPPSLVFDRLRSDVPNLSFLAENGSYGTLESCIPAITVPAWSSMLASRDPGTLGFYGFRNRRDHSYDGLSIATSGSVRHPRVWDYVGEAGLESIVVGVPQTFPPPRVRGHLVSGFLTPDTEQPFTYPSGFRDEVLRVVPDYQFDVSQFRTDDKERLLKEIRAMTESRFALLEHLLHEKSWDLFLFVEIGVDRIHHGFWEFQDETHHRYRRGNRYEHVIRDYYREIDARIGRLLHLAGPDTIVIVVSDHGAQAMDGGICVNEWLLRQGYLALAEEPPAGELAAFKDLRVDWKRTVAWGEGGYYGRIFLNVEGREPAGAVAPSDYEEVRSELAERLASIPGPEGQPIGTVVYKPEEIYAEVNGVPPDLLVYFGNLRWRSIGSIGHEETYTRENDTGPDSCNHADDGLFILYDPRRSKPKEKVERAQLMDIGPTILEALALPVPEELQGRSLWW